MRYLLDTNIFIFAVIDRDALSHDVKAILEDYDNTFCVSAETVRELIVAFNTGSIVSRQWKTASDMIKSMIIISESFLSERNRWKLMQNWN